MDKEKVLEILKKAGINLETGLNNPQLIEKACTLVYKTIPIPFRWFVGKKRIKNILVTLKDKHIQSASSKAPRVPR